VGQRRLSVYLENIYGCRENNISSQFSIKVSAITIEKPIALERSALSMLL
jgi:hypothetical protein